MVLEILINGLLSVLTGALNLIPTVDNSFINGANTVMGFLSEIIKTAGYFLPLNHLMICFGFFLATHSVHAIWSAVQRVWDGLPLT